MLPSRVHQINIIHLIITGCETNTRFGHIFLPSSLLPEKHHFSALWHSHLIKKKMMNCKRDHIFDCVTGWRNRLMFDSLKKHESPIGLLETEWPSARKREREVELWDFFPNEKNKGRGFLCPEFSFLDFRRRENESEHAVGVTVLQRRWGSGWEHHHYSAQ